MVIYMLFLCFASSSFLFYCYSSTSPSFTLYMIHLIFLYRWSPLINATIYSIVILYTLYLYECDKHIASVYIWFMCLKLTRWSLMFWFSVSMLLSYCRYSQQNHKEAIKTVSKFKQTTPHKISIKKMKLDRDKQQSITYYYAHKTTADRTTRAALIRMHLKGEMFLLH